MSTSKTAIAVDTRRNPLTRPARPREISSRDAGKIPRRALVVDDEPLIRWSVTETLASLDLDVEQAGDAASALRMVLDSVEPFDVIVLDLRLPDMKDLSLMGTIRQLMPGASIVLMTAFGTDDVVERAKALGACSVLQKPFEIGKLIDAVYGNEA